MKSFKTFLLEHALSFQDALKIFGFDSSNFTKDELKNRYKKLAMELHPDRGGDLVKMQKLNIANDMLQKAGDKMDARAAHDASMNKYREERDRKKKIYAPITMKAIEDKLDIDAFQKHIEGIFGEPFTIKIDKTKLPLELNPYGHWSDAIKYNIEFANPSHTTVLTMDIHADYSDMLNDHKPKLSYEDLGLKLLIRTEILHDRRKIKLTQQNYLWQQDYGILSNPEKLFPKAKLTKKKDTEKKKRKISKRDILLTMEHELGASYEGHDGTIWLRIPVGDDYTLTLYRTTLMKLGSWSINGLYKKKGGRVEQFPYGSIYETEPAINFFVDKMKEIQKLKTKEEIAAAVNEMMKENKERAEEFLSVLDPAKK